MQNLNELRGYHNLEEPQLFKLAMSAIDNDTMSGDRANAIQEFIRYMDSAGYQILGFGKFGIVCKQPSMNYCIKIFKRDPAYLHFVKIALRIPNPFFPRFRGHFMRLDGEHYAVRMEILTPVDNSTGFSALKMNHFAWSNATIEEFFARNSVAMEIEEEFPGVFSAIEILRNNKTDLYNFDIHKYNLMFRGKQLVIIDPFFTKAQ